MFAEKDRGGYGLAAPVAGLVAGDPVISDFADMRRILEHQRRFHTHSITAPPGRERRR
jgi:hypothetical protein